MRRQWRRARPPGPAVAAVLAQQHQRVGRALQRLAAELYTDDSHFVLELIQNADDGRGSCQSADRDGGGSRFFVFFKVFIFCIFCIFCVLFGFIYALPSIFLCRFFCGSVCMPPVSDIRIGQN